MSRTMGKLNTGIPQVPIVPVGVDPEIAADRQGLPIFAHRTEIIQTINQNQVKYFFLFETILLPNLRDISLLGVADVSLVTWPVFFNQGSAGHPLRVLLNVFLLYFSCSANRALLSEKDLGRLRMELKVILIMCFLIFVREMRRKNNKSDNFS
jgi:hypothetical protein